jgi:hypothetical protein
VKEHDKSEKAFRRLTAAILHQASLIIKRNVKNRQKKKKRKEIYGKNVVY